MITNGYTDVRYDIRTDKLGRKRRVDKFGRAISFDTVEETKYIREYLLRIKKFIVITKIEKAAGMQRWILEGILKGEHKSLNPVYLEHLIDVLNKVFGMPPPPTWRLRYIEWVICNHYSLPTGILQKDTNEGWIVKPRQIAMYFASIYTKFNHRTIGKMYAKRDRATVFQAIRTVKNRIKIEREYRNEIEEIDNKLKSTFQSLIPASKNEFSNPQLVHIHTQSMCSS